MTEFQNFVDDENYLGALFEVYFDSIGVAYVEDRSDINFWSLIIDKKKYKIKVFTRDNGCCYYGKDTLEKQYDTANKHCIIAVDGDFDYICPISDNARKMISNPYILHTFGYGRESILYNYKFLNEVVNKFVFSQGVQFDIINLINLISEEHYDSLVMYLFLRKFDNKRLLSNCGGADKFHEKLELHHDKFKSLVVLYENSLILNKEAFEIIQNNLRSLESELYSLIEGNFSKSELDLYKKELVNLGLTPKSTYRYINSHILEERIILPILRNIKECQKKKEIDSIIEAYETDADTVRCRKQQIQKHFDIKCGIDTIVHSESLTISNYLDDDLFKRMSEKYQSALV